MVKQQCLSIVGGVAYCLLAGAGAGLVLEWLAGGIGGIANSIMQHINILSPTSAFKGNSNALELNVTWKWKKWILWLYNEY